MEEEASPEFVIEEVIVGRRQPRHSRRERFPNGRHAPAGKERETFALFTTC
ncbi:hypothetical protein [Ktedonobacter robiniae]|uniref:Uncharacterized protein n=1 Tax=Ktedonobacter robiniae TaxID=2778365 RepID=A0ABQ3UT72_9CHLR|nr:hypothetical protein [Ktedonobacter robiniae]GHO55946.1 hypothetical protein KSB_44210 [Ktedonobacter robiniae]